MLMTSTQPAGHVHLGKSTYMIQFLMLDSTEFACWSLRTCKGPIRHVERQSTYTSWVLVGESTECMY